MTLVRGSDVSTSLVESDALVDDEEPLIKPIS